MEKGSIYVSKDTLPQTITSCETVVWDARVCVLVSSCNCAPGGMMYLHAPGGRGCMWEA